MCPPLAVLQPATWAAARRGVTSCPAMTSPTNMDDEFADAPVKECDGDRAARAPCADEKCSRSVNLGAVVPLCLDEGEPVEHVAVPGAVRVAPDDAHDLEHLAR